MSERQRDTEFLQWCIGYDDTAERHKLEARIAEVQRNETCVRRAAWLMALFTALAMAGLGYVAVFLADYPLRLSQFTTELIIRILCAVGGGSLVCMVSFVGMGAHYRSELDQRRADCRKLATKLLESRLGPPCPLRLPAAIKTRLNLALDSKAAVDAADVSKRPAPLAASFPEPPCRVEPPVASRVEPPLVSFSDPPAPAGRSPERPKR
jgi:hypothetical protein